MTTELTPFTEITAPREVPASAGEPVDPALGRLTAVVRWSAARRGTSGVFTRPRVVVFAGAGPDDVRDADLDATVLLAEAHNAGFACVDLPVDTATIAVGSDSGEPQEARRAVTADVLDRAAALAAIDRGRRLADREIDGGADLLIPGLAGGGQDLALGVLTAVLTGLEPVAAVTVDDSEPTRWVRAVMDLRDTLFRLRDHDRDVVSLIAAVGGPRIGALAGLLAQAAVRRTPVLLDGLPAVIAAVLAHRMAPGAEAWFLAAGEAPDRPGRRLQDMLALPVVAALGTGSPTGAGAVLVLPLIQAALAVDAHRLSAAGPPAGDRPT
jgi:nicotinate-nucleotide--dimethylbenzimidazole phosphoribosyltransferase